MNIVDIIIIFGLLLGGTIGAKNGFFKQGVVLIGTILVIILSWTFKNPIADFLSFTLPFFKFTGPFKGLVSLNIIMYQLIAFLLLSSLFTAVLVVLTKITGVFEKILKFTIILGIPSKILGFILGFIEGYVIVFTLLFFLNQPAINFDQIEKSTFGPTIINSSPGLSNIVSDMNDSVKEIYAITKNYNKNKNPKKTNEEIIDSLLKHKVINEEYLEKLREKGKI